MKPTFIIAALAATATVNAYQCPDTTAVKQACSSISVRPLVCSNPKNNVQECNAKQCNQAYIDNYSACQCVHSSNNFYEHSINVEGLVKRCGLADLKNPYGNPYQYRSGQGTQTFAPVSSGNGLNNAVVTRFFDGTTYYGGQTGVVAGTSRIVSATAVVNGTLILPGTTTWVANTPGIINGTSTAAPSPTSTVTAENNHISGGAIAGIVLGTLAAAILAGLLGWCWREKRNEHTAIYSHSAYESRGPTRTVVTEKIEPVVVRSNSNNPATATTGYGTASAIPATGSTAYTTPNQSMPVAHNSTTYNTTAPGSNYPTTTTGYNTQPRTGGVGSGATNAVNDTTNAMGTGVSNAAHGTGNAASNAVHGTSNAASNAAHGTATNVGSGVNAAGNTTGTTYR
ncbi:hypothetical protein CPC16_008168 [Podila verticillata]|nr:hypothetical protein CPC16_008168 [Podila verticillata]